MRRGAILWFIASALSLTAAILTFTGEHRVKWPLLTATVFMAAIHHAAALDAAGRGIEAAAFAAHAAYLERCTAED